MIRIPSHRDWLAETSRIGQRRSSELQEIDRHVLRYNQAVSDYGHGWEANELRVALNRWKKTKGRDWKKDERNKTNAFTKLEEALCDLGYAYPLPSGQDALVANDARFGLLYFLSHCNSNLIPQDWKSFVDESIDKGSDIHKLVDTSRTKGVAQTAKKAVPSPAEAIRSVQGQGSVTSDDTGKGFLDQLYDSIKEYLTDLCKNSGDWGPKVLGFILEHLPQWLKTVLGEIAKSVSSVVEIAGNFKKAGRAALATFSSRHLEDGVLSGHPRNVIHSVRDQIKGAGWDAVGDAVKKALLTGVSLANPVAGVVVNAVAAVWKFITDLWDRLKTRFKLTHLIAESKIKLDDDLHESPDEFNEWFLHAIKDLPILSAYCLGMPMIGSYYGFLTLVSTDGSSLSYDQLERNYGEFVDVKKWAREFIQKEKVKLSSDDKIVALSLKVARGEDVGQKLGWAQRMKKWLGSVPRVKKTVMGLIENAAG